MEQRRRIVNAQGRRGPADSTRFDRPSWASPAMTNDHSFAIRIRLLGTDDGKFFNHFLGANDDRRLGGFIRLQTHNREIASFHSCARAGERSVCCLSMSLFLPSCCSTHWVPAMENHRRNKLKSFLHSDLCDAICSREKPMVCSVR